MMAKSFDLRKEPRKGSFVEVIGENPKRKILLVTDFYLPGYKAGGPIRASANLVQHLGSEFDFYILTRDRDYKDKHAFSNISVDQWVRGDNYHIQYLSPGQQSLKGMLAAISRSSCDLISLSSFFSRLTIRVLILRRLGLLPRVPCILSVQGEFSPEALKLRRIRKSMYVKAAKMVGLFSGLYWNASSSFEEDDIRKHFGGQIEVFVSPDLSEPIGVLPAGCERKPPKEAGRARIVFLSRISRMKNLHIALSLIGNVRGTVQFDIYGPIEELAYWRKCEAMISRLPDNISCEYMGSVPHDKVLETLSGYDFFFLPTRGENFGHVIIEALTAGLPVVISDNTPWKNLQEKRAGWDISLNDWPGFMSALDRCAEMEQEEYLTYSMSATNYAKAITWENGDMASHRETFYSVLGRPS